MLQRFTLAALALCCVATMPAHAGVFNYSLDSYDNPAFNPGPVAILNGGSSNDNVSTGNATLELFRLQGQGNVSGLDVFANPDFSNFRIRVGSKLVNLVDQPFVPGGVSLGRFAFSGDVLSQVFFVYDEVSQQSLNNERLAEQATYDLYGVGASTGIGPYIGEADVVQISFEGNIFRLQAAAVPEPASWALMIAGFGAAGAAARRRTKVRVTFA